MAAITPALIKELRDRTGVGMGKCKEALEEANGDIELAISNLRKAGMASAVKKEGRATNEGVVVFAEKGDVIAIVEVNAETDFVVKNERFQEFAKDIAAEAAAINPETLEAFLAHTYSKDPSLTIDQFRATVVQAIGENIQIRRVLTLRKTPETSLGLYSHLGGKIATVVELSGSNKEEALAKDIAMHVAAASPDYLNPEQVPAQVIEQEKEIAKTQLAGKPANIIEKILEGKVSAFFDQVCLTNQKYIRDDSLSVNELVAARGKESGHPLKLTGFWRWSVGQ